MMKAAERLLREDLDHARPVLLLVEVQVLAVHPGHACQVQDEERQVDRVRAVPPAGRAVAQIPGDFDSSAASES